MQTKLTLRIDEEWILKAKNYAAREGRSVSELVAAYFKRLDTPASDSQKAPAPEASSRKSSFYGLLKNKQIDSTDTDESAYKAHLTRKHQ